MSAAGGNRLREGQVFAGVLDIDPLPSGDDESPGSLGAPATGQRYLSLWERMIEALDMEFTRNLMGPDELSDDEDDGEDDDDDDSEVDGPTGRDGNIGQDRETNGKANATLKRNRAGLYATLGELAGVGKQGRHAR